MIDISVVVPLYNEQGCLGELYQRIDASVSIINPNYELLFVNDGSTDTTLARLIALSSGNPRVKYISLSRNFGHQIAISAGLDYCKGKAVVIIDGDLQDPPELIPELYSKYREGYDVVYAKRIRRKGETLFKKASASLFYRILRSITRVDIPVDVGDFRLIDRKIVDYLRQMPEQNKFLRGQIAWLGFRQTFVEFEREGRRSGKTGYPMGKMVKFALDGITGFSNAPLRMVTNFGLLISLTAFIIILYALYSHYILHRTITGWTSLIISSMFIGGVQLLSIGIIGEYINRINTNVQNRPLYIVDKTNAEPTV
jgi:dolichol-phosphate mannosyltransferase